MKSTKFKQNILAKLGISMAAAVLGMMSGANLVQNVLAASVAPAANDQTAKTTPTATSTVNNQLGFGLALMAAARGNMMSLLIR